MSKDELTNFKMHYEGYYASFKGIGSIHVAISSAGTLALVGRKVAEQNYLWRKQYAEKRNS